MAALLSLRIEKLARQSVYVQIYQQIRRLILSGRLGSDTRLPATRALAADLAVSRSTIVAAYDQLLSEGYVRSAAGSGIYVMPLSPDFLLHVRAPDHSERIPLSNPTSIHTGTSKPFEIDAAVFDFFPARDWTRRLAASWRQQHPDLLSFQDPFGHWPLREAISAHLSLWRGFECTPDQIIITSGTSDALDMVFRILVQKGEKIWMEDPGFSVIRHAAIANGASPVPVPLDDEGFNLAKAAGIAPHGKMAIVTPSRQFPSGTIMSLTRRLELLDWARNSGGWIVEDDYDSEYRYEGQPFPAMAGMDEHGNTLYLGSFSKVMFRSLRLAYLVCPPRLTEAFKKLLTNQGTKASFVAQPALADFMASGAFAAHIRKTRRVYGRRLGYLQKALSDQADGLLLSPSQTSGIHLIAALDAGLLSHTSDKAIAEAAKRNNVHLHALSDYFEKKSGTQGLVMGFAGFDEQTINEAVGRLVQTIRSLLA